MRFKKISGSRSSAEHSHKKRHGRHYPLEQEEKLNEEFLPPPMPRFTLNAKQNEIYQALSSYLDAENKESKTALLFGVTGSGKTALYLELAQKALQEKNPCFCSLRKSP